MRNMTRHYDTDRVMLNIHQSGKFNKLLNSLNFNFSSVNGVTRVLVFVFGSYYAGVRIEL